MIHCEIDKQGLFFTQADPQLWQEKRQALFQVAHDNQEVKILKTFGRDNMGDDYCAIQ